MTFAQLTVLAEAAREGFNDNVEEACERSYDGWSYLTEGCLDDLAQNVYDSVIEAGRGFVRPLHPIIEVD